VAISAITRHHLPVKKAKMPHPISLILAQSLAKPRICPTFLQQCPHMRILLATAIALCSLPSAHAGIVNGISNAVNNAFTFREDQKERVAPRRYLPPKVVQTPNFNTREQTEWARTYTRQDLTPVDYMAGSASKVMRPDPRRNGTNNTLPGGGTLAMLENRARQNAAQNTSGRIYIGDAGTGPGIRLNQANVGKQTQIGDARADWRQGQRSEYAAPRAGDYNYKTFPNQYRGNPQIEQEHAHGSHSHSHAGHNNIHHHSLQNGKNTITFHENGVSDYTVRRGDTLTTISEQPQVYGNWKLWPLIQQANKAAIGNNPHNIHPNQNLSIPRNLNDSQVRGAVRNSTNWR